MKDAPRLLRIPKSECPDIWIRLPRREWPKSWSDIEDPVVPLERNLYGHLLAGPLWERQFEEVLLELGFKKVPNWECLFVHRKQGLFFSVLMDDINMAGKKQNMAPMWKKLMKHVRCWSQARVVFCVTVMFRNPADGLCAPKTRIILIGTCGRQSKWQERGRIWLPCGRS